MGLGTANNCAGEDHQQITRPNQSALKSELSHGSSWALTGPEFKNNCAGEGRQQFTRPDESQPTVVSQKNMAMGPETKNDRAGGGQLQIIAMPCPGPLLFF
jgi:hypothetical protein